MFSKRLKLIASLVLLLFLVACGGSDSDDGGVFGSGGTGSGTGSESAGPGDATDEGTAQRSLAIGSGQGDSFREAVIDASTTNLSSDGSAQLTFNIIDRDSGNALMSGEPEPVKVTSRCIASGEASITPEMITTSDGSVEFTYQAGSCTGTDTVTAELTNGGTASVNMSIASRAATALVVSAPSPLSLAPNGLGNSDRISQSEVVFTLTAANGAGIADKTISFQLYPASTDEGAPTLLEPSQQTNSSGQATATVRAGTAHRIVRVTASYEDQGMLVETTSMPIAINTRLPTQQSFTIGPDTFAPNAWSHNGEIVNVTVQAADVKGNWVRDGLVSFTATGGAIEGDCTLDSTGECTVQWRSQKPRPDNGWVTIEAFTVGTTCTTQDPDCARAPELIQVETGFVMASDVGVEVMLDELGDKYCATAKGSANGYTTPLPAGSTLGFTVEGDGKVTSSQDTLQVENPEWTDRTTYCVSAIGPGEIKATATLPNGRAVDSNSEVLPTP